MSHSRVAHDPSVRDDPSASLRAGADTSPAKLGRNLSYAARFASAASCMMVTRQWMRFSSIG